jgi:riboflavin biosynthesis pyrimidine reductase
LSKTNYAVDELRYEHFYPNGDLLREIKEQAKIKEIPQKVKQVMGEFILPSPPENRPYTFGCMVLSMDGKMAFHDDQEGHLISQENRYDPRGGLTDFWIMNVSRAYADGVILGSGTMQVRATKKWFAEVKDKELIEARLKVLNKQTEQPWSIIATLDGTDLPLEHQIFDLNQKVGIITSPWGVEYLSKRLDREFVVVNEGDDLRQDFSKIKIITAGEGKNPDTKKIMEILRKGGIEYLGVEAPSYIWHLMSEKMLDEFLLNYSGVYVGGEHILGKQIPYSTKYHPHCALLSVGFHKGFIFTRQKVIYS